MKAPIIIAALLLLAAALPVEAQTSFGTSSSSSSSSPFVQFGSGTLFGGSSGSSSTGAGSSTTNPGGFGQYGPGAFGNPNANTQNTNSSNMFQNSMSNRSNSRNQLNGMGGYGGNGSNTVSPRISITLGEGPAGLKNLPPSGAPHYSPFLTERMNSILRSKSLGSVQVLVLGSKAILRGSIATDHTRDLAGRLLLLEPGIETVQNDLTVGSMAP
jgi:hypothetical protein